MSVQSQDLPPVPQHTSVLWTLSVPNPEIKKVLENLKFHPTWMNWFLHLQFKANVIDGTVLSPTAGGTGISSYTTGDILVALDSDTLTVIPAGLATYALTSNGPGNLPTYQLGGSSGGLKKEMSINMPNIPWLL